MGDVMTDPKPEIVPAEFWPHGAARPCLGPIRFMGTGWGTRSTTDGQTSMGASFDYTCVNCGQNWFFDRLVPRGEFGDERAEELLRALQHGA